MGPDKGGQKDIDSSRSGSKTNTSAQIYDLCDIFCENCRVTSIKINFFELPVNIVQFSLITKTKEGISVSNLLLPYRPSPWR
jgi:hypothetical protein